MTPSQGMQGACMLSTFDMKHSAGKAIGCTWLSWDGGRCASWGVGKDCPVGTGCREGGGTGERVSCKDSRLSEWHVPGKPPLPAPPPAATLLCGPGCDLLPALLPPPPLPASLRCCLACTDPLPAAGVGCVVAPPLP